MYFHSQTNTTPAGKTIRGFGLVELMVSISIMMLLSSIILVRHTAFNGAVLLRSQAYEVAFALRRAQLMAVSGNNKGYTVATSTQQYGIYVDTDAPNSYILFHDVDADGQWDGGTIDTQIGVPGNIDKRFEIRGITNVDGGDLTGTANGYNVTFIRPNFDAKFKNAVSGTVYRTTTPVYIDIAQINADSDDDSISAVRRVEIGSTGEISVTSYTP